MPQLPHLHNGHPPHRPFALRVGGGGVRTSSLQDVKPSLNRVGPSSLCVPCVREACERSSFALSCLLGGAFQSPTDRSDIPLEQRQLTV